MALTCRGPLGITTAAMMSTTEERRGDLPTMLERGGREMFLVERGALLGGATAFFLAVLVEEAIAPESLLWAS